jgi:ribosome-associated protein
VACWPLLCEPAAPSLYKVKHCKSLESALDNRISLWGSVETPPAFLNQPRLDDEKDAHQTMRPAQEGARTGTPPTALVSDGHSSEALLSTINSWLDDAKAENIVTIPLKGKSSLGDYMIVASGRSDRHVGAIAEQIQRKMKDAGYGRVRVEGQPQCDWVLIDTGDIIVHVFRPEVREFYNLEKMWSADRTLDATAH